MPDAPAVCVGDNSPEHIAYRLLSHVVAVEGMSLDNKPKAGLKKANRKWILDAYAECLSAIRHPAGRKK